MKEELIAFYTYLFGSLHAEYNAKRYLKDHERYTPEKPCEDYIHKHYRMDCGYDFCPDCGKLLKGNL